MVISMKKMNVICNRIFPNTYLSYSRAQQSNDSSKIDTEVDSIKNNLHNLSDLDFKLIISNFMELYKIIRPTSMKMEITKYYLYNECISRNIRLNV